MTSEGCIAGSSGSALPSQGCDIYRIIDAGHVKYLSEARNGDKKRTKWLHDDHLSKYKMRNSINWNLPPNCVYGFKHTTNELGWADYRLTDYPAVQLIFSAYLMVRLPPPVLHSPPSPL